MLTYYKNFEIKSSYMGDKQHFNDPTNFNNYMIRITNIDTKNKISFEHWTDSYKEGTGGIDDHIKLMDAFLILLKEAVAGSKDFEIFLICNELDKVDLTEENQKRHKLYHNRCLKMYNKLLTIYDGNDENIANLLYETQRYINEISCKESE